MRLLIALGFLVALVLEASSSPYKGKHPPLCGCPPIDDPVCASNHKVYKNSCFMGCDWSHKGKPLRVVKKGNYCPVCGACLGPPVCGLNGKTYGNICELKCDWEENTKKAYDGPCKKVGRYSN